MWGQLLLLKLTATLRGLLVSTILSHFIILRELHMFLGHLDTVLYASLWLILIVVTPVQTCPVLTVVKAVSSFFVSQSHLKWDVEREWEAHGRTSLSTPTLVCSWKLSRIRPGWVKERQHDEERQHDNMAGTAVGVRVCWVHGNKSEKRLVVFCIFFIHFHVWAVCMHLGTHMCMCVMWKPKADTGNHPWSLFHLIWCRVCLLIEPRTHWFS